MQQSRKPEYSINSFSRHISRWLVGIDYLVLLLTATGLIVVALIVLFEAFSDFFALRKYSVTHIVSGLMFVLIILELFRQVFRQIMRFQFSINPFLFISIIASTRGILITQMKLAENEISLWDGLAEVGIYGVIVFIMVISYYFSLKASDQSQAKENAMNSEIKDA